MINVGSDFSGVGAFNQALDKLGIDYNTVFACDWDKYARQTYIHNYVEPDYYPSDVYDREIPKNPLDIYMTSPPCQAFSLAGKRKGEKDKRGILFYNSHEFIVKNKPRYFIFENVKELLSDDSGKTFNRWLDYLGGKSVNGNPVIFPLGDSTPYHIYHKVLNAKNYGVPQNRERVFIVGIRDDSDNTFTFPKKQHLTKRLKDVLENDVDEKYYLSDKMISYLHQRSDNFNNGKVNYKDENDTASCITKSSSSLDISDNIIKIGNTNPSGNGMNGNVFDAEGISPTLSTNKGEGIKVRSTNEKVMIAHVSRSEEGKRLRKESMVNGKDFTPFQAKQISFKESDVMNCITTATTKDNLIKIGAIRGRGNDNNQRLELNLNETSNALTTVQKDNVVVYDLTNDFGEDKTREYTEAAPSLRSSRNGLATNYNSKIRRLTPRECMRLMDFPDTFTWTVSNSQAYKQAGNSIVVAVLAGVISKLNL
jgi:DNA (cytosine-5)-methyltransferase 1